MTADYNGWADSPEAEREALDVAQAYDWNSCIKCGKPRVEMTGCTVDYVEGIWCYPCNVNITVGDLMAARKRLTRE